MVYDINFYYRPDSEKKIFDKLKEPYVWHTSGPFLGKKYYLQKI